jgi:hypothetical protein
MKQLIGSLNVQYRAVSRRYTFWQDYSRLSVRGIDRKSATCEKFGKRWDDNAGSKSWYTPEMTDQVSIREWESSMGSGVGHGSEIIDFREAHAF